MTSAYDLNHEAVCNLTKMSFLGPVRTVFVCQRCFGRLQSSSGQKLKHIFSSHGSLLRYNYKSSWSFHSRSTCLSPSTVTWHTLHSHRMFNTSSALLSEDEYHDTVTTDDQQPKAKGGGTTSKAYWQNTFVTASRAMTDYLLDLEDLEDLSTRIVRSAHIHETQYNKPMVCYLKSDIEKRALEVWGSWQVLEHELQRRRLESEEEERRRKGLSAIIAHLKKYNKEQTRKQRDVEAFGARRDRVYLLRGSAKVVMYAILSNFSVFVFKLIAYFYSGSAAMLSEAVHSLADMLNQCLLAFGIAQSIRVPDPDHPYGWSRARYVYSLISGVGIFFLGAGVTCYHGIMGLLHPPVIEHMPVAFSVLGASALVEAFTLWMAVKQVKWSASESGVSFKDYVLRGRDPSAVAVLMEDSAAVIGVFLAAGALGLTHFTGNSIYDALGSISIGGLLGVVALFLINRNSNALVGQSMHPERMKQITDLLESDIIVRSVHDVKATDMGADTVRFKAEVNFDGREVSKIHLNRLDLDALLKEAQSFTTTADMEKFLLAHGEQIVDLLGSEVDRIELEIKKQSPEVRHVDLEIL